MDIGYKNISEKVKNETSEELKTIRRNKENFEVLNKFETLSLEIWRSLKNFPKWERNGITIMIKASIIDFEKFLSHGRYYPKTRKSDYKEAQYSLFKLSRLIKKSMDLKYISLGNYSNICEKTNEVGKMLRSLIENETKK